MRRDARRRLTVVRERPHPVVPVDDPADVVSVPVDRELALLRQIVAQRDDVAGEGEGCGGEENAPGEISGRHGWRSLEEGMREKDSSPLRT